jgi:hypothetical protein
MSRVLIVTAALHLQMQVLFWLSVLCNAPPSTPRQSINAHACVSWEFGQGLSGLACTRLCSLNKRVTQMAGVSQQVGMESSGSFFTEAQTEMPRRSGSGGIASPLAILLTA